MNERIEIILKRGPSGGHSSRDEHTLRPGDRLIIRRTPDMGPITEDIIRPRGDKREPTPKITDGPNAR